MTYIAEEFFAYACTFVAAFMTLYPVIRKLQSGHSRQLATTSSLAAANLLWHLSWFALQTLAGNDCCTMRVWHGVGSFLIGSFLMMAYLSPLALVQVPVTLVVMVSKPITGHVWLNLSLLVGFFANFVLASHIWGV